MSKKDSINRRIMVIFISITSIVLISFGSIITVLFNKNYHSTKLSNLEKQMDIIETSINNYLNQQDGSYQQLKQIIKMACISTNSEAIITDRLGYVYLVNGEDYENLLYSKIELDTESLSSNIEFKKEVFKVDNASIKGYVKAIYEDGENAYFSNLPIKAMVKEMIDNGIPASVSNTAGTFVCNHVMYGIMYMIDKKYPNIKGGFIHVPYIPSQVVTKPNMPSMSASDITKGLELSIKAAVENKEDVKAVGGEIC